MNMGGGGGGGGESAVGLQAADVIFAQRAAYVGLASHATGTHSPASLL
jgi:hypothetical protein